MPWGRENWRYIVKFYTSWNWTNIEKNRLTLMIQWSGNLCCNDNVQTFKPLPLSTTMTYTSWESTQSIAHILYCSNFVQVQGFSRWIANIPHARLVTGKRCPWHPLTMLFQGALKPCRSMTFQTGHTDGAGSTLSVQKKWQIWTLTNSSIINQTETYKTWKNHRTTFGWNTTFVFRSWGSLQSTWSLAKFQELSIRFVGDDRVNYMFFPSQTVWEMDHSWHHESSQVVIQQWQSW